MAKKTLEEKRVADTRYLYHFEKVIAPKLSTVRTDTYALVKSDLTKTILITTVVLSLQIILFLTLKNHLFRIPGISY